jgi:hypothetical protein
MSMPWKGALMSLSTGASDRRDSAASDRSQTAVYGEDRTVRKPLVVRALPLSLVMAGRR